MAEKIDTLIRRTRQFELDRVTRLFRASVEGLRIENDAFVQDQVLTAILNRGSELKELLKRHIASTADYLHPRLTLVPFLRENALVDIAKSVLREMNELQMTRETRTPISGTLSYREAIVALGISTERTLSALCELGLLETARDFSESKGSRQREGISSASCDSVLRKLWRSHTFPLLDTRMRPPVMALTDFMLRMMNFPQHCGGYDLETGLSSLCIGGVKLQPTHPKSSQIEREDYLTLDGAADALGIKKYLVSSMAAVGWLKVIIDPSNPPAKLVCVHSVKKFNMKYVCFPRPRKDNNFPPSVHSSQRLRTAGVLPVGGPNVDGTKVYIFRKRDVEGLDIRSGKQGDMASLGEPVNVFTENARARNPHDYVSLPFAAKRLGITLSQTRMLVNKKFLQQARTPIVGVMILRSSIESYDKMVNDFRFVELEKAASSLAETKMQFLMRWIVTGVVKSVDVGLQICIHQDDITRIRAIKRRFVLAPDCARLWKVGRFKIPNMETRGLIASTRMGDGGKVRLYLRADVENLLGPAPDV